MCCMCLDLWRWVHGLCSKGLVRQGAPYRWVKGCVSLTSIITIWAILSFLTSQLNMIFHRLYVETTSSWLAWVVFTKGRIHQHTTIKCHVVILSCNIHFHPPNIVKMGLSLRHLNIRALNSSFSQMKDVFYRLIGSWELYRPITECFTTFAVG